MMADPDFVAMLEARVRRMDEEPKPPLITGARFLAMTAEPVE